MTSRGCKYSADAFCYICGEFIKERAKKYQVKTSVKMCEAYHAYFGMPVRDGRLISAVSIAKQL
jgi:hypothetical protein